MDNSEPEKSENMPFKHRRVIETKTILSFFNVHFHVQVHDHALTYVHAHAHVHVCVRDRAHIQAGMPDRPAICQS
jgi:hypothetical protein